MSQHPSDARSPSQLRSTLAGDPDVAKIIGFFVDEMPDRIEQIEAAHRDRNLDDLKRVAHQLKRAAGGYGFQSVGDAAARLEQTLREAADRTTAVTLETINRETKALVQLCQSVAI